MKLQAYLLLVLFSVVAIACGSRDDDFDDNGIDDCVDFGATTLNLTIQESFTTLPAKVSVFFKVNENDGSAVAGLNASNFEVYERGRNDDCFNRISSAESSAVISSNSQIFKNNTFLVLDLSNSVLSGSLTELKEASIGFINNVMPAVPTDSFRMGIYWFDGEDELHVLNELTTSATELQEAINGIDENISEDPSTDLYGAVIKSAAIAEEVIDDFQSQDIFAAASIVLFTDGTDQAARYTRQQAQSSVDGADENLSFFAIGLGSEIDEEVLTDLGTEGSVFATNSAELEQVFNEVSANVAGQANSFYLFEYCSPKRDGSGTNDLIIRAVVGEMQGAVQTEFDAAGFTGGCQ